MKIKNNASEEKEGEILQSLLNLDETCEIIDNRIYFYSEITISKSLELNKNIRTITNTLLTRQILEECYDQKIFLHINSIGGEIHAALSVMDTIVSNKIPIYTIIDGFCASAASFLSVVGKKRYMSKNSFVLIHQCSSGVIGTYSEFVDKYQNMNEIMKTMKEIYLTYTKIPEKKLNSLLKQDLYLSSEDCLKYGIVDEIIS